MPAESVCEWAVMVLVTGQHFDGAILGFRDGAM